MKSLLKGFSKLTVNKKTIEKDLDDNWPVIAEAIQTILRRENYPDPYEKFKELTRTHDRIDKKSIQEFINSLNVDEKIKSELRNITPFNYTGV